MQVAQSYSTCRWRVGVASARAGHIIHIDYHRINPVFDVYRVTDTFPNLCESNGCIAMNPTDIVVGSVLGFPRSTQEFVYFNRTDVRSYHAAGTRTLILTI